ncbi:MAG: SDR family NAD(P)-dependent oxidoreductase [Burkholderiales bacterium]
MFEEGSPTKPRGVALVTGSAKRIGREIALRLARDGFDLAIHAARSREQALDTAAEAASLGVSAEVFEADLADEMQCEELLPRIVRRYGRVDAIVNNASAFDYDDVASLSYARLTAHMNVNVGAALVLSRQLHEHLVTSGERRGVVVNMLDQRLWNPNPDYLSYALSKGALELLTRVLALDLAPTLRVVGVAPGLTTGSDLIDDRHLSAMAGHALTRKLPTVQEVAATVSFAVSNQAFTGSTLMVDAGFHLNSMRRDFPFL